MSELNSSREQVVDRPFRTDRLEALAVPCRQQRRHVAPVAAADHADPSAVTELVPRQRLVEHGDHVVDVDRTPPRALRDAVLRAHDRLAPRRVPPTAATRVRHEHDEARRSLHLGLVEERLPVLSERSAVHVEHHRIALGGIEVGGAHDPRIDLIGTVGARHAELLPSEPVGRDVGGALRPFAAVDPELRRMFDHPLGGCNHAAGGVEVGDRDAPARERLRSAPVDMELVQVRVAAVLGDGDQALAVEPHRRADAIGRGEGAIEVLADPSPFGAVDAHHADLGVLGVGLRVVLADEADEPAVGRHGRLAVRAGLLGQRHDLAVERNHVEVAGEIAIPGGVALGGGDHAGRIGQPTDPPVLELAGCEVARLSGAVGCNHVDVSGTIEDEVLAVEPGEEAFDLPGRLPAHVLGFVARVAGTAGEGDPASVWRPVDVVEPVRHRAQGAHLARSADRHHVEGRVALGLAAAAGERQPSAVSRPCRLPVVRSGGHRRAVEPHRVTA